MCLVDGKEPIPECWRHNPAIGDVNDNTVAMKFA